MKSAVDGGADVNEDDEDGDTPLFYAAFSLRAGVISFLLEKGADPHKLNKNGMVSVLAVFVPTVIPTFYVLTLVPNFYCCSNPNIVRG